MIYLDYVATSPLNKEVYQTYINLLDKYFVNSDSLYDKGIEVHKLLEKSRLLIANILNVSSDELIFTSSGSEANNLAIKGVAMQYRNRGKHIITSVNEHSSVYETCKQLEQEFGFEVTYLPVDSNGCVNLDALQANLRNDTILVSLMYVNNELGSINDINRIKDILKGYPLVKLHVDMVQALGKILVDLNDIDLASFSAHKINGLKGSGLLYKKTNCTIKSLISGGQQEFGLRAGTENYCTNIVFAKTLRIAMENYQEKYQVIYELKQYLVNKLRNINGIVINGDISKTIATIINISIPGYKPEVVMHYLASKGIYVSTRSACSSKSANISRSMAALDCSEAVKASSFRISLSHETTKSDLDKLILEIQSCINELKKQR